MVATDKHGLRLRFLVDHFKFHVLDNDRISCIILHFLLLIIILSGKRDGGFSKARAWRAEIVR